MKALLRSVDGGSPAVSEVLLASILLKRLSFQFNFEIIYGRELIAGGSPVSEKYMETCFSSNIAGGSPAHELYMETKLKQHLGLDSHCSAYELVRFCSYLSTVRIVPFLCKSPDKDIRYPFLWVHTAHSKGGKIICLCQGRTSWGYGGETPPK